MLYAIWDFLSTEGFQPHGMCLLWRPDVFWTHFGSDLLIALSYFSIPAALIYFAVRRSDLVYRWVLYLFGAFIVACGLTHVFGMWTMWVPDYGAEAIVKLATALVSVVTAISLWPLMPKLLAVPSARQMEEKNVALAQEVSVRKTAEAELQALNERRVSERTESLQRVNDELELSRAQAVEANRAKSEFLAKMSHELRTPLNAIIGFSEVIKDQKFGPAGNDSYPEYTNDIHESGRHLLDLINDILDLSKIEAGAQELDEIDVDVPQLMRSVLTVVQTSAQKNGIELELDIPANAPALRADQRKFKQVLLNLLSNAIKFTPSAGKVTLRAWFNVHRGFVFQVADTGTGIAARDIPHALAAFRQVDNKLNRKHEGTGLGLPLSKSLVELHGGCLDLQSEVDVGTTVTVRLPAQRIVQAQIAVPAAS